MSVRASRSRRLLVVTESLDGGTEELCGWQLGSVRPQQHIFVVTFLLGAVVVDVAFVRYTDEEGAAGDFVQLQKRGED